MMDLVFPFRNIVFNTLWDFFKEDKIIEYSNLEYGHYYIEGAFEESIEIWKGYLPSFENEILQVINTTDQKTIDQYFEELSVQLGDLKESLAEKHFVENISLWNTEILTKYNETIEKETKKYSEHENRKRPHLEKYVDWAYGQPVPIDLKGGKIKKTNYNFYCIEKKPDLIDERILAKYLPLLIELYNELFNISKKYGVLWDQGKIKSKFDGFTPKPVVFVEGEIDIQLIKKAAEHLEKGEIMNGIEIRNRGGSGNLDKLWSILKEESWETIPQIKIFLYDCDTHKIDEDFAWQFKRVIPPNPNSNIKKGIENLFSNEVIEKAIKFKRAFIDYNKTEYIKRGECSTEVNYEINKDEKTNFCKWICEHGTKEDFEPFAIIFDIIQGIIEKATIQK